MGKNPAQKAKLAKEKTPSPKKEKAPKELKAKTKAPKVEVTGERSVEKGTTSSKKCRIKTCKRAYRAKGYCKSHYRKWRHGEYGGNRYKLCHTHECRKPMAKNRHGLCEEHFQSFYIQGTAPAPATAKPALEEKKTSAPAA